MDLDASDESILQRLLVGDLDPASGEAVQALGGSWDLRQRWKELRDARENLSGAALEADAVLADARDIPSTLSVETIEGLVRREIESQPQPARRNLAPLAAAAALIAAGLVGWLATRATQSIDPLDTFQPTDTEGLIILGARISGLELHTPRLGSDGFPVIEWSDVNASLFTDYVVVVYDGERGEEVLRSATLRERRWAMDAERSARLPRSALIEIIAYGPQPGVPEDTSERLFVSFELLFADR